MPDKLPEPKPLADPKQKHLIPHPEIKNEWILRAKHKIKEEIVGKNKIITFELHWHHPRSGKWDTSLTHQESTPVTEEIQTEAAS